MTGSLRPAPTDMVRFAVADLFCAIDLHGTAVPVIDLHRLLGRQPAGIRPDQHLLVLSGAGGRLAARCDRVEGLVRMSIQPSPGAHSPRPASCWASPRTPIGSLWCSMPAPWSMRVRSESEPSAGLAVAGASRNKVEQRLREALRITEDLTR